jgi:hypothetical protein
MDTEIRVETDRRIVRVGEWALTVPNGSEEPLIEDEELATRLGYARPRKLRELIKRLIAEGKIKDVVSRPTVGRQRTRSGERTFVVDVYFLTEEQALKVIAKSETKAADAILDAMIKVFRAAVRGLLVPPDVRLMQGKIHQLEAQVETLLFAGGATIGPQRAKTLIRDPIAKAARALCVADCDHKAYRKHLLDLDHQLRMHCDFPKSHGQSWDVLPISSLGRAQSKVAELQALAERRAERTQALMQTDMFKAFTAHCVKVGLASEEN